MIGVRDVLSTVGSVARHAHASRDEIVACQNRHLCRLVDHAYRNVPYYRTLFDRHGITPHDVRMVADLTFRAADCPVVCSSVP